MKRLLILFKEKWPEYFLEILVITIGILGAFLLNSWNEKRKTNQGTKEALVNVLDELQQDAIQFQFHIDNSKRVAHHLNRTIHNLLTNGANDSLEYYYQRSKGYLGAVLHNSAFQALNEQGLIPNIGTDSLRLELMRYYNFVQPSVMKVRDFEYIRLEATVNDIDTDSAIDMDRVTLNELQLDYIEVRKLLLEPENLKKLYLYRDTQNFLAKRAQVYVDVNKRLIISLSNYLNR